MQNLSRNHFLFGFCKYLKKCGSLVILSANFFAKKIVLRKRSAKRASQHLLISWATNYASTVESTVVLVTFSLVTGNVVIRMYDL